MIELETMLMQFCLETSGRLDGDRYPVGKGKDRLAPIAKSFCGKAPRYPPGGNSSSWRLWLKNPLQRNGFGRYW